uniref:WAP domain-containing protein n=1 Tax=Periophthalmus magnuspinnatus TaxID=409849 RepID=A0A3B4B6L6_9GOBI
SEHCTLCTTFCFLFLFFFPIYLKLFLFYSEKPGVCPKPRTDIDPTVVRCLSECSSDSECEGNLKCCFNGCGRVCEKPRGNMSLSNTCGGCFLCIAHGFSVMVMKSHFILVPPLCIN